MSVELNVWLKYCYFFAKESILYVCMLSRFSHVQLCDPISCSLPGSSVHGILQATILERVAEPSSGDLPNPGIEPTSHVYMHWQAGSLPLVPLGKPILYV